MRFVFFLFMACIATTAYARSALPPSPRETKTNLTILADDSFMLPAAQLVRFYSMETNTPMTLALKHSSGVEAQIMQGLESHVMLTADRDLVARLTNQGLTDVNYTRPVAETSLALVASRGTLNREERLAQRISFAALLAATPDLPVFFNAPDTMDGARAAALLSSHAFSEILAARAVVKPTQQEVIAGLREEHGLALMIAAEAVRYPDLMIVSMPSESISPPVTYDAVIIASESMDEARGFANFLHSEQAQRILAQFGYQSPN